MARKFTKYPAKVVASTADSKSIDSAIAMAKSQLRDASEHFVDEYGEDCFAIYEDDAIKIVTDILNSLKGE